MILQETKNIQSQKQKFQEIVQKPFQINQNVKMKWQASFLFLCRQIWIGPTPNAMLLV